MLVESESNGAKINGSHNITINFSHKASPTGGVFLCKYAQIVACEAGAFVLSIFKMYGKVIIQILVM